MALAKSRYNSISGEFFPKFPNKFKGPKPIIYKSRLEYYLMLYLDKNPAIVEWGYEKTIIPYYDTGLKKNRRYFIDFSAKIRTGINTFKTVLIEVKSKKETHPPIRTPKQSIHTFNEAMRVWMTNSSKWKAAKNYARLHGLEFVVITEDQLL